MEFVFNDSELFRYSDSELSDYISSLPFVPECCHLIYLSSKYIAKGYVFKDTVDKIIRATKFASQLGVPVPQIHRVVRARGSVYYIADRIPGKTLQETWPTLSWIESIRLAFQLRHIIRRLRSQPSMSCGILESCECESYFLDDRFKLPPNANANQVNAFLNFWYNFTTPVQERKKTPEEHAICPRPVFTSTRPFVFTHHKIAPRNLIVDPQGKLWVVNWKWAGYYPDYFEYAGMFIINNAKLWTKFALWRWRLFAWISAGFYDKERKWLMIAVSNAFIKYKSLRQYNIRAGGYAAAAGRMPCQGRKVE